MAIHRWRAVIDFYAEEIREDDERALMTRYIGAMFTRAFPCGVVEGYPDVYDQDEKRAKIDWVTEIARARAVLSSAAGSGEE